MTDKPAAAGGRPAVKMDTSVPHYARVWNYWLDGHDNYPADRDLGEARSRITCAGPKARDHRAAKAVLRGGHEWALVRTGRH